MSVYLQVLQNGNAKMNAIKPDEITCPDALLPMIKNPVFHLKPRSRSWLFTLMIFTMFSLIHCYCYGAEKRGTFRDDRDGQIYEWVLIGKQVWMAQNLNYKSNSGSYFYDNDEQAGKVHGRLYTWDAVMKQDISPRGWHVPSNEEWEELATYVAKHNKGAVKKGNLWTRIGTSLKARTGWAAPQYNGTDNFGFAALPAGRMSPVGVFQHGGLGSDRNRARFWSTTEADSERAWNRGVFNGDRFISYSALKGRAISVRCVRDVSLVDQN